jgi:AraC-like DNA-binding protein
MRTQNLDEATQAITKVYCPHTTKVTSNARDLDIVLEILKRKSVPLVRLSFNAPINVDAQDFSRLFLMMHCSSGSARAQQGRATTEWRKGETVPFSAGVRTSLAFDKSFVQKSVRLDLDKLESVCAHLLGHPLPEPFRFALKPFSTKLENIWQGALGLLWSYEDSGLLLAPAAKATFDEFLYTLVLHGHPHNYTEELMTPEPAPAPGIVRRAERLIIDCADTPITVGAVASELGVSVRTIQAGFRQWRSTTPREFLREIRLQRVRDELSRPSNSTSVTSVAMRWGFMHAGRFSSYYRARFGESPSVTLRRGRGVHMA